MDFWKGSQNLTISTYLFEGSNLLFYLKLSAFL